jgi:hypothetical protein
MKDQREGDSLKILTSLGKTSNHLPVGTKIRKNNIFKIL